jgi:hypothetical protein
VTGAIVALLTVSKVIEVKCKRCTAVPAAKAGVGLCPPLLLLGNFSAPDVPRYRETLCQSTERAAVTVAVTARRPERSKHGATPRLTPPYPSSLNNKNWIA